jgi:hypothetical protein
MVVEGLVVTAKKIKGKKEIINWYLISFHNPQIWC